MDSDLPRRVESVSNETHELSEVNDMYKDITVRSAAWIGSRQIIVERQLSFIAIITVETAAKRRIAEQQRLGHCPTSWPGYASRGFGMSFVDKRVNASCICIAPHHHDLVISDCGERRYAAREEDPKVLNVRML